MDLSIFNGIAEENAWGSKESISGPGSTLEATASLRRGLAEALSMLQVRSLVDAPCGDMNWMRHLHYTFERFIGIDIVPAVIERLKTEGAPATHHFQVGNIVTDILPRADALLCRDCLVHLPFSAIQQATALWRKAGFTYIFATTFYKKEMNEDCQAGEWRTLNMEAAPIDWPQPIHLIADNDGLGPPFDDKALGVWKL